LRGRYQKRAGLARDDNEEAGLRVGAEIGLLVFGMTHSAEAQMGAISTSRTGNGPKERKE
jgi:hypothetical protein